MHILYTYIVRKLSISLSVTSSQIEANHFSKVKKNSQKDTAKLNSQKKFEIRTKVEVDVFCFKGLIPNSTGQPPKWLMLEGKVTFLG